MHKYQYTITVTEDDLDELNHVNNVRYVKWIQDIAKKHWQQKASEEIRNNVIWVVLNHFIEYKFPAVINDEIVISTFIKETRGAKSIRTVEMHNAKTKTLLVRSDTEWCLLNAKTLKPIRVPKEITNIFMPS